MSDSEALYTPPLPEVSTDSMQKAVPGDSNRGKSGSSIDGGDTSVRAADSSKYEIGGRGTRQRYQATVSKAIASSSDEDLYVETNHDAEAATTYAEKKAKRFSEARRKDRSEYRVLIVLFWLSFVFPPFGWVGFFLGRHASDGSPRGKWAFRCVAIGSALAAFYMALAAFLVGGLDPLVDSDANMGGCGFGGSCPIDMTKRFPAARR